MSWEKFLNILPWRKRRLESPLEYGDEPERRQFEDDERASDVPSSPFDLLPMDKDSLQNQRQSTMSNDSQFLNMMFMSDEELKIENPTAFKLIKSVLQGNFSSVFDVLSDYSTENLNSMHAFGQKILHLICWRKDEVALRGFLDNELDPNATNDDGITPLHLAVSLCWTNGVELLLQYGAKANILPEPTRNSNHYLWPYQELPILTSARKGDLATALLLLSHDPNLRLTDANRNTVLHLSASARNIDLIMMFLKEPKVREMLCSTNNKGNSILHCLLSGENLPADEKEILECAELLLQRGLNVNALNSLHKTPLYLAARSNLPLVVQLLLDSGADPAIRSKDGRTVLHAACRASSPCVLKLLLGNARTKPLLLFEDESGFAPFHVAVSTCSIDCCEILIKNGDNLTQIDTKGRSRWSLLLNNVPSSSELLKRIFDANVTISNHEKNAPEFHVQIDFSVLLSKSTGDVEASLISDLYGSEQIDSLLKHPLVESYIYLKWHRIRWFFYLYVFLYFCFLLIHTFYIIRTYGMDMTWVGEENMLQLVHVMHATMVIILLVMGTVTTFVNLRKYFTQLETYFRVIALSTAVYIVFSHESQNRNSEVERIVASVSIFLTWVEFMMLLGRFPSLGVYILMFTKVAKSIILFLLAFSPLLIAFSLTFSILFSNIQVFEHFPIGFVKTLMMMIGEIDHADIYDKIQTETNATIIVSHIFLVIFLFLITILMANLLIGLAVNNLPDLQTKGKIRRLVKEASYLESFERILLVMKEWTCVPNYLINLLKEKGMVKRQITIYPNRASKYGVNSTKIPSEAIDNAVEIGLNRRFLATSNLESDFKSFVSDYQNDKQILEKALNDIYEALVLSKEDATDGSARVRKRSFLPLINKLTKKRF